MKAASIIKILFAATAVASLVIAFLPIGFGAAFFLPTILAFTALVLAIVLIIMGSKKFGTISLICTLLLVGPASCGMAVLGSTMRAAEYVNTSGLWDRLQSPEWTERAMQIATTTVERIETLQLKLTAEEESQLIDELTPIAQKAVDGQISLDEATQQIHTVLKKWEQAKGLPSPEGDDDTIIEEVEVETTIEPVEPTPES